MASKLNYTNLLMAAQMDAITAQVGSAGILKLYDNTAAQPAGPSTAVPGSSVLLATFTLGSPFAPAAVGPLLSPTLPANVNAAATGTQLWFRVYKSDGTTAVIDGSAGTSGCDMNLSGTPVSGQPLQVISWTMTNAQSGL